jgi:hypothetical protein
VSLLGLNLTLLIGPHVPTPAPPPLIESLRRAEVTQSDDGRSVFQLEFHAGRAGPLGLVDYPHLLGPWLQPFSRVVLVFTFGSLPRVLMDGVITNRQLSPGREPGTSTLSVTGEDLSVLMDLEEKSVEHPAQHEGVIALKLIGSYAMHGIVPLVIPPMTLDVPLPIERVPVQQGTDLSYLKLMASRHGYVFHVTPGPLPLASVGYFGPPKLADVPQRALTVDMGEDTNVQSISFRYDALAPTAVSGKVQDTSTGNAIPIRTFTTLRPPLSVQPALPFQGKTRVRELRESGLSITQAMSRAQAMTDASTQPMSADGELDGLRYRDALRAGGIVGVRGVGFAHDGFWYLKRVTHALEKGSYRQRFSLARDGTGSTTPMVPA